MDSTRYVPVSDQRRESLELLPTTFTSATYDDLNPDHEENERSRSVSPPNTAQARPISGATLVQDEAAKADAESDTGRGTPTTRPVVSSVHSSPRTREDASLRPLADDESARRLSIEERVRYSVSPATHHFKYPSAKMSIASSFQYRQDTARMYRYWQQARRLWRLAVGEWVVTAALCGAFAGVLSYYYRQDIISRHQALMMNSLTTGLTFLLGVNLTASMRSYAKLLRWLLLSLAWQPLATFDLILRCESLLNVVKLLWTARKHKTFRYMFITQTLCALWLLSNLALMLFVGMIGLTYSLSPNTDTVMTSYGDVLMTNFSIIRGNSYGFQTVQQNGERAVSWLMSEGFDYDLNYSMQTLGDGEAHNWFNGWNPQDTSVQTQTRVEIGSIASCTAYDVIAGADGRSKEITYRAENGTNVNITIGLADRDVPGPGGFVALSDFCADCDDRSANVHIFVPQSEEDSSSRYFDCVNYVTPVRWRDPLNVSALLTDAPEDIQINNLTARVFAGAIGWNGRWNYTVSGNTTRQPMTYWDISDAGWMLRNWYPARPSEQNISDFVASYTIKSFYYLDKWSIGLNVYKTVAGRTPIKGQVLEIDWYDALWLLIGIPGMQLIAMLVVLAVANKAIVKDDSALSMAKLYYSMLDKYGFGERGCMLKGDEVIEMIGERTGDGHGGPEVIYSWKEGGREDDGRRIGHLDIFEKRDEGIALGNPSSPGSVYMRDKGYVHNIFYGGINYDGVRTESETGQQRSELRRRVNQTSQEERSE